MSEISLKQLFDTMLQNMGSQGWWPAETKEEIILGAFLVQNTNWKNVEKSLINIQLVTNFNFEQILNLNQEELIRMIRPSGFYKNKSRAILDFLNWCSEYQFDYCKIKEIYGSNLRNELLGLFGIGEETADVLLLYIFEETVFIADKYAQRLFSQLTDKEFKTYRQLREEFQTLPEFSLEEGQEFHGLIDEFGKIYFNGGNNFSESFLTGYRLILDH